MKNEMELDAIAKEALNSLVEKDLTFIEVEKILEKMRKIMLREIKIKRIDWVSILITWFWECLEASVPLLLKLSSHLQLMCVSLEMGFLHHNQPKTYQYIYWL